MAIWHTVMAITLTISTITLSIVLASVTIDSVGTGVSVTRRIIVTISAGVPILNPRHPRRVIVVGVGVVLLGSGLTCVHVVSVHVVRLRHARRLRVGSGEWLRFGRRNWFVDAGLGWRQRLVVRIPAMIRSDEDLVTVAAAVQIKLFPNLHDL